jgi:chromosome segregation ATPase
MSETWYWDDRDRLLRPDGLGGESVVLESWVDHVGRPRLSIDPADADLIASAPALPVRVAELTEERDKLSDDLLRSRDVQHDLIRDGQAAQQRIAELEAKLERAQGELSIAHGAYELASKERGQAQRERDELEARLREAEEGIVAMGRLHDLLNTKCSLAVLERDQAQRERDEARAEVERWKDAGRKVVGATLEAGAEELAKALDLLHRIVKYAREDRAVTPGYTRLARALEEAEALVREREAKSGG